MHSHEPASARRRAYLRAVSLGVPGLLLSGWAPVLASARSLTLALPREVGPVSPALRAGVALGLDDVDEAARLLGLSLSVRRDGDAAEVVDVPWVVVADVDGAAVHAGGAVSGMRIHTCRLAQWRRGAWSVASPPGRVCLDWHDGLRAHGAGLLNDRFVRRTGVAMDERAWRGWMAVKVAFDVALRASAGERDVRAMRFDGYKGQPLHFGEDGHLVQPTYETAGFAHAT